jgi:hypothetical protein
MSAGVALSKTRDYPGARLGFPTWIRRMGASKHARGMRKSLSEKLSRAGHTSRGVAQDEFLPFLQAAFRFDDALALRLALALELEEAEISFLLGDRATKANLKKFLAALEAAEGGPAVEEPEPEPEPAAETKPEKGPTQKGLFEF